MKILVLSDEECKSLWDYFEPERLEGIDLIISCGDLKPQYLSFLATFTKAPILYVHGNHDERYDTTPPDGCISIEDDIFVFNGIRIMGLGGSMKYNKGKYQYTQRQMKKRVSAMRRKLKKNKGFDILVTHSPAYKFNDAEDLPHTGFEAFITLLDKYKPKYFVHGHVHLNYNYKQQRACMYNDHTTVINAYERYVLEYEE